MENSCEAPNSTNVSNDEQMVYNDVSMEEENTSEEESEVSQQATVQTKYTILSKLLLPFTISMASSSIQTVSSPRRMKWRYDVFVSFRGEDTRNNFTNHLFGALHKNGIDAFRDDTNLKKGENISQELVQAIEESHIFIIIFSRNYASSTWCLRELAKIVGWIEVTKQTVLPIFYDVSPSEVRKQSGHFEKAFREHEERFKENLEEVQRWRGALKQVADLSGWDMKNKPEHAEIEKIIKKVTCLLGIKSSTLLDEKVGMHSRVKELENLLILDSDDVRVVGISGMGGIGKTTLATALYDRISNQFDACCLIDDVSKIYRGYGPIEVQKQLLCQTLKEENLQIWNHSMASNLIQTRLCQIKSLVVLDNVDKVEQLDKLAMTRECLGTGSRIIVISRDDHILRVKTDGVYKVQPLDCDDALQLFCRKAFKGDDIKSGYKDLTDAVLRYVDGHPLAIEVLGSFLNGREVSEWRSALERLRENPMTDIMKVLRISYDGLDDKEKEIFLDIACFFKDGRDEIYLKFVLDLTNETYLKRVLDFRGFYPEIGLPVLIDKSFITFKNGTLFMHDLLEELGKSIVREKSPKEPRKWNRLWDPKDVHNVISENMATENLEAIVLHPFPKIQAMSTLRADALAKMTRLKLLMLWNLNFSGNLNFLSSELGYLEWGGYPFTCLPSSFEPDKLVQLILHRSNISQLWKGTKYLPNLTHIDLSHSRNLIKMPSFLEIPNLEYLILKGCIKLVQIDPSVGILQRLSKLILENCTNLVNIPNNVFGLSSLKHLNLSGCTKLLNNQQLEGQRQTEHLEMLDNKESTTQYQLTPFIYNVLNQNFGFSIFRKQEGSVGLSLPLLYRLSCLQYLNLSFCNLIQIPDAIGWLHYLEILKLGGNNFVTLPSMKELSRLRELNLAHCKQLIHLPELPSKNVLPIGETISYKDGLYIFDCPSLIDVECCYRMAFSWMIQHVKVYMKSDLPKRIIDIVIPKTQIPTWCIEQNVGSSIGMDPLSIMDDKNWIGVACCITFVAHDDPTSFCEEWHSPEIGLGFQRHGGSCCTITPIHFGKDLITVDLEHLLLTFFTREEFKDFAAELGFHDDISGIEFVATVEQPTGLHLEVKNCGYRWIFKKDVEQLNS